MMQPTPAPTWSTERDKLIEILGELPQPTLDALRHAGALERHTARVDYVLDCALATFPGYSRGSAVVRNALGECPFSALTADQIAPVLGQLYIIANSRNARPGWGAQLGKGRRLATDGPAWDAAIREATHLLECVCSSITDASLSEERAVELAAETPEFREAAISHLSARLVSWRDSILHSEGACADTREIVATLRRISGLGCHDAP